MAIVSYNFERPSLSEEQKAELWERQKKQLQALDEIPDDDIDYSDIPEVTDFSGWMTADEANALRAAKKKQVTAVS
jgi:hypothetical protein